MKLHQRWETVSPGLPCNTWQILTETAQWNMQIALMNGEKWSTQRSLWLDFYSNRLFLKLAIQKFKLPYFCVRQFHNPKRWAAIRSNLVGTRTPPGGWTVIIITINHHCPSHKHNLLISLINAQYKQYFHLQLTQISSSYCIHLDIFSTCFFLKSGSW